MEFKHKEDMELFFKLHPILMAIMVDMYSYCYDNNMPFIVTDTISTTQEDKELGRISSSHRTHRAADVRVRGWDNLELKDFQNYFNEKYKDVAAVSRGGDKNLFLVHNSGHGIHGHIQIHSKYSL